MPQDSTLRLLVYAWRLLQLLLGSHFPVRGAVTRGPMYVNEQLNVFLGEALVRAYELEQQQQWIGVAIDPSVLSAHPDLANGLLPNDSLLGHIFREYDVPMKGDRTERLRTLNWRFNLVVKDGTRWLFAESDREDVAVKIQNTLAFAKSVVESGYVYARDDNVPVELRGCFVGDTEPPFSHGDDL